AITGASPATTTRDLADLVEKGALLRQGQKRHARYRLAIPVQSASQVVIDEHGNFDHGASTPPSSTSSPR
ncbi:MAG TPA: hypothetical protein VEV85_20495, partial [Bryobacteraceae bacterium]|nr:hypothetical protein [Bryobacteraceae bacterium]